MAYVPSTPEDEESKRRAAAGTAPGSFGDTTPTSTPTKTNFVNVSEYLGKNPDASKNLGDMAVGKLEGERDAAKGAVLDTQSKFGQQVEGGSTKLDNDFLSGALSNPTGTTSNPESMAKFMALRDASYKGPQNVETTDLFAPTQSKVTALGQRAQSIGTEAGRNSLVEGLSVNPTKGKTSLNQLVMQGNPEAAERVSNTAGTFKDVDYQWQDFLKAAPGQVSQAKADTSAARDATRSGLQQTMNSFSQQTKDASQQAETARQTKNQGISDTFGKLSSPETLLPEEVSRLGVDPSQIANYNTVNRAFGAYTDMGLGTAPVAFGQSASPTYDGNTPTAESMARPEDFQRDAALEALSGISFGLNNDQANLAGTYKPGEAGITYPWQQDYSHNVDTLKGMDKAKYAQDNLAAMGTPEQALQLMLRQNPALHQEGLAKQQYDLWVQLLTRMTNGYGDPTKWNTPTGFQLQPTAPTTQGGVFRSPGVI